ncbi:hypothetical protein MIR68_008926 [Amoeboaphelidium protococcarum]|nr:hypothetical protein MIR68_008926 [Amoeboaphelidium protococcarum]
MDCPSGCNVSVNLYPRLLKYNREKEKDLRIASELGTSLIRAQERLQSKLADLEAERDQLLSQQKDYQVLRSRILYLENKVNDQKEEIIRLESAVNVQNGDLEQSGGGGSQSLQRQQHSTPIKSPSSKSITAYRQAQMDGEKDEIIFKLEQELSALRVQNAQLKRSSRFHPDQQSSKADQLSGSYDASLSQSNPNNPRGGNNEKFIEMEQQVQAMTDVIRELSTLNDKLNAEKVDLEQKFNDSLQELSSLREESFMAQGDHGRSIDNNLDTPHKSILADLNDALHSSTPIRAMNDGVNDDDDDDLQSPFMDSNVGRGQKKLQSSSREVLKIDVQQSTETTVDQPQLQQFTTSPLDSASSNLNAGSRGAILDPSVAPLIESLTKNIQSMHKRIKQTAPLNLNRRLRKTFDLTYLTGLSLRILDGLESEICGAAISPTSFARNESAGDDGLWKSILILSQKQRQSLQQGGTSPPLQSLPTSPNQQQQQPQLVSPPLVKNAASFGQMSASQSPVLASPPIAIDKQSYRIVRTLTAQVASLLKDNIALRKEINMLRDEFAQKLQLWSTKDAYEFMSRLDDDSVEGNGGKQQRQRPGRADNDGRVSPAILELSKAFLNKYVRSPSRTPQANNNNNSHNRGESGDRSVSRFSWRGVMGGNSSSMLNNSGSGSITDGPSSSVPPPRMRSNLRRDLSDPTINSKSAHYHDQSPSPLIRKRTDIQRPRSNALAQSPLNMSQSVSMPALNSATTDVQPDTPETGNCNLM